MMLKILLGALLLGSLSGSFIIGPQAMNKKIKVIGIAEDDKDGAILVTDKEDYIIDRLDEWDKKFYHKRIQVTGRLVIEIHKEQSTPGHAVQERVGKWHIIKNAKWELVK